MTAVPPVIPVAVILLDATPEQAGALVSAVRLAARPFADEVFVGTRLPVDAKKYEPDGREIEMERLGHAAVVVTRATSRRGAEAAASAAVAASTVGSLAIVGDLHVLHPGTGAVLGLCLFRRAPATSRASCYQHWTTAHADLAARFPGHPGYAQLHLDPGGAGGHDYEGAAMLRYADLDAMAAGRNDPDYSRQVTDDEKRFLDHSRSSVVVFSAT